MRQFDLIISGVKGRCRGATAPGGLSLAPFLAGERRSVCISLKTRLGVSGLGHAQEGLGARVHDSWFVVCAVRLMVYSLRFGGGGPGPSEIRKQASQGYLTYKNTQPPRTLPQAHTYGPRGVGVFLLARYPCTVICPIPDGNHLARTDMI